jgi:hypothetical protein
MRANHSQINEKTEFFFIEKTLFFLIRPVYSIDVFVHALNRLHPRLKFIFMPLISSLKPTKPGLDIMPLTSSLKPTKPGLDIMPLISSL